MANFGYVKLYRQMMNWEWYKDANTSRVFIHCLLKANHEDGRWQGHEINKGSFISSYEIIAGELGLTLSKVKTAINHLKMTGEIATKNCVKGTMFMVLNYNCYQENRQPNEHQIAGEMNSDSLPNNFGINTNNNKKNEENDKKIINSPQNSFPSSPKTKTELIPDYNKVNDIEISDELMKKYFPN